MVELGADKDKAESGGGRTPLALAAAIGNFAVVKYLVEQGADKKKADSDGFSPLMAAQIFNHVEVAAYLRAAGAR